MLSSSPPGSSAMNSSHSAFLAAERTRKGNGRILRHQKGKEESNTDIRPYMVQEKVEPKIHSDIQSESPTSCNDDHRIREAEYQCPLQKEPAVTNIEAVDQKHSLVLYNASRLSLL